MQWAAQPVPVEPGTDLALADGLYDDAVSRAYYAVFHSARAALKIKGIETVSHKGLISQFALHLVKAGEVRCMDH